MGAAGCSEGVDGEGGDIIASVKAQGRGVHMAFLMRHEGWVHYSRRCWFMRGSMAGIHALSNLEAKKCSGQSI